MCLPFAPLRSHRRLKDLTFFPFFFLSFRRQAANKRFLSLGSKLEDMSASLGIRLTSAASGEVKQASG